MKVLYEDNHCIIVYKPAGVLVQSDKTGDRTLGDDVKDYLKEKGNKPGEVFLGIVHRLDRPVDGIVIFAKTSKGASRLSAQLRNHEMEKVYLAWVDGVVLEREKTLKNYLVKDEQRNIVRAFSMPRPDSKEAILSYKVIGYRGQTTLLEVQLQTGRSHQIRAQLAVIGHPIVGDEKYGSLLTREKGTIGLTASKLCFNLPVGGERKCIEIPVDTTGVSAEYIERTC
ncbi:MAG: RNA pseudouridine synthase [bacterium]|nr:RNA pseudouridine synthase [bacterium]